jgi:hypothetical protein
MNEALNHRDVLLIAPVAKTNSTTTTANLDTKGASWASIRIALAAEINTNAVGPTISLLHSDDTVATNFATITADRTAEDITAAKEIRYDVDCRKHKRYLRLSVTVPTATNDNITVSAIATLSRLEQSPSATASLVETTGAAVVVT